MSAVVASSRGMIFPMRSGKVAGEERLMYQGEIKLMILGTLAALTVGCGTHASTSAPGLEPYTPTKLEWLEVEAQTELSENAPCYAVNITRRAPETIVV